MNSIKRLVTLSAALTALGLPACSTSSDTDDSPSGTTASLRVVHLSPDAPAIDVFMSGMGPVVSNLAFEAGSAAADVEAGRGDVQISATGSGAGAAVATVKDTLLDADRSYTAFAFGKLAAIQASIVENDKQGLATGNVRVRVIHTADGVGTVDVFAVPETGAAEPLITDLRYGTAAEPVDLPAEAFVVGLDLDNDAIPDLQFGVPALEKGTVVNVFAVLDQAGAPFLLAQLDGATTARIDPSTAELRVLHLSPDAPAVDAFVDGATPTGYAQLSFTNSTPYATLAASSKRLDISADGTAAGAVLSVAELGLTAQQKYTAVAVGRVAALQALLINDDAAGLDAANIRVRAIHGAPDVGQVDVYSVAATDGAATAIVSDVDFGVVSDALDLPAGAYTLGIDANNDAKPDVYFELPALAAGSMANLFVTQDDDGGLFLLAQLDGATTARIDPSTSEVRVIHLSRDAPDVDVYANGSKVVDGLAYADATDALVVGSGTYDFAVTAKGAAIGTAVLNANGVVLLPGRSYTIAAYDDVASIKALVLVDDDSGLNTSTDIRLTVTHVAPTVTRGDVFAVTGSGNLKLVDDIGFGESAVLDDLVSAAYVVGFDAEANGTIDISFNLPVLAPGSFANAFVATDAENVVYILVQTKAAGTIRVNPN